MTTELQMPTLSVVLGLMHVGVVAQVSRSDYFKWARLVYAPLYAPAIPLVRSLAWNVAKAGIILIMVAMI